MNREIKFRGFSEELKCFVYGFYHEVEAEGVGYSYIFFQGHTTPVRADSVAQFTGQYDKKLKEIYEGDIILGYNNPHVVTFADGAFYLTYKNSSVRLSRTCGALKIIGNIYENPELLTI